MGPVAVYGPPREGGRGAGTLLWPDAGAMPPWAAGAGGPVAASAGRPLAGVQGEGGIAVRGGDVGLELRIDRGHVLCAPVFRCQRRV